MFVYVYVGGEVAVSHKGVTRVIWQRPCRPGSIEVDKIPFLNISRSLGDYWSFNPCTENYIVSPEPHVSAIPLNPVTHKFIVIASDGLWGVMTPNDVVSFIHERVYYQFNGRNGHQPRDVVVSLLIQEALAKWKKKGLQADNITVLVVFLSKEDPEKCNTPTTSSDSDEQRVPILSDPSLPTPSPLPPSYMSTPNTLHHNRIMLDKSSCAHHQVGKSYKGETDGPSMSNKKFGMPRPINGTLYTSCINNST